MGVLRRSRAEGKNTRYFDVAARTSIIWNELAYPAARREVDPDTEVDEEAATFFWSILPTSLQNRAREHVWRGLEAKKQRGRLLFGLLEEFRTHCHMGARPILDGIYDRLRPFVHTAP